VGLMAGYVFPGVFLHDVTYTLTTWSLK